MLKTKMSQTFHGTWEAKEEIFFRKPPALHRLLFMPPFAGDIRARAGSLKWIAQIPCKAYRSLGSGSKCCDGVSNVEAGLRERIFIMPPPRQKGWSSSVSDVLAKDRAKRRSSSGVVFNFADLRSRFFSLDGGDVDQKIANQTFVN